MTTKKAEKVVNVVQSDPPIAADIMAKAIVDIAEGFRRVENSRLSRKALVVLIQNHSKVPQRDIELVLNNLAQLDQIWLKPVRK